MIIFLPVRNGGTYVREAIDSIIAQHDPDWRLVVLENASTDSTVATITAYRDSRIILLPADRPLDIYDNWHRIWTWLEQRDLAEELVTMIGHDDALNPDFVGAMRALAEQYPDATLYQSSFDLIDSAGDLIRPSKPVPQMETWQDLSAALCWGLRDSFGTGYVFRARDYRQVGGIPDFPSLLYSDDLLFIRLTRLGYKAATDLALCRYRLHPDSASNNLSRQTVNDYIKALDQFVTAFTIELSAFSGTGPGGNSTACLIGRQLAVFDRPGLRDLLSLDNRDSLMRLRALFALLSPTIAPRTWAGMREAGWFSHLRSIAGIIAFARVRVTEWLKR